MLEIDLKKIVENWKSVKTKTGVESAAVLKADAYGMGAKEVGTALLKAGCKTFFVIHPEEGIVLREAFSKSKVKNSNPKIYILGGPTKEALKELRAFNLTPVLNTKEQALLWKNGKAPCAVHLFTGMRRFSMPENEWAFVRDNLDLNIDLLMSHLACADIKNHPMNNLQRDNFLRLVKTYPKKTKLSLAASEFPQLGKNYFFDMIRPGFYLYADAVSLGLKIRQIQSVGKGDPVGYNNTFTFKKDGKMASVFMGYADGLARLAQEGNLCGYVGGYKVPLIGRVSMDISTFDLSGVPDKIIEKEGRIELIGKHASLGEIAKSLKTIGYEVLTNLRVREGIKYK